jgi:3-isopropylmalate/(R)-2-methylmalate dehydratase large subunit
MTSEIIRAGAWRFGDNVDTDQMAPFNTFMASWEKTRPALFPARPGFAMAFETGGVIVAGKNWGCGSSREQAPSNLKKLGVAAVVADSVGRIFFRNAIALALPCLVCPGVSDLVEEGDLVEVDFAAGVVRNLTRGTSLSAPPPTADMLRIIEAGGLLETLKDDAPRLTAAAVPSLSGRPKTMAEKILARAAGRADVAPGEFVVAEADRVVMGEFLASSASRLRKLGITALHDPEKVSATVTAVFPAPDAEIARLHTKMRALARELDVTHFYPHDGIINQVIVEKGDALPGQLVFGSDSHSTTYGAMGAAGSGLGVTELTYILATGRIWMRVPATIRFNLNGQMAPGVMSKDLMLALLARFGTDHAQYRAVEFGGEAADRMSMSSRLTLSNMGLEMGAKFAMFAADETTLCYLRAQGVERAEAFGPDPDAAYATVHEIDVSVLAPQVARPHNPGNVGPVSDCAGTPVDQAFLGSCTNARLEDLAVAAGILRGRKVAPSTRLIVTPASREVMLAAMREGHLQVLLEAGAHLTPPGCGACSGGVGGVVGPGETCIATTNRNFQGRMGSPEAAVYLASPATVAVSAVRGVITDPREFWTEGETKALRREAAAS